MTSAPLLKCSKTGTDQLTHLTALVFLPPPEIQARLNALRSAHDRSFARFTAHITLPFVEPSDVDVAVEELRTTLGASPLEPFEVVLDHVYQFRGRHNVTVYLAPDPVSSELLCRAARVLMKAFRLTEDKGRPFSPHLTVGQASHANTPIELLTRKAKRLLADGPLSWTLHGFMFLRKDVCDKDMLMRPYAFVPFDGQAGGPSLDSLFADPRTFATFAFSPSLGTWQRSHVDILTPRGAGTLGFAAYDLSQLAVAPSRPHALLSGQPDLLVLHGVTDAILAGFLYDAHIRTHFAWCSHGTGSVLPFERNIVVFATSALPFAATPRSSSSLSMQYSASDTLCAAHLDELSTVLLDRPAVCIVYAEVQRSLLDLEEPPGYACHVDPQFALHGREPGYCILARSSCATVRWAKFRRGALGCAVLSSISKP